MLRKTQTSTPLSNGADHQALRTGMGLGLLVGYVICAATINGYTGTVDIGYRMNDVASLIYGACVLLLGGVGLLVAFVVEMNMNKK